MTFRRSLALGVVATTLVAVAGCSSSGGSGGSGGATTGGGGGASGALFIQVGPTTGPSYTAIAKEFQKANPNVKVTIAPTEQNAQTNALLQTQLQSGGGPDMLALGAGSGGFPPSGYAFAQSGFLEPLDGASWIADLPKDVQELLKYKGSTYLYPNGIQAITLSYDQSKLSELGITAPTTTDEMIAACGAIRAKNPQLTPFAIPGGNAGIAGFMVGAFSASTVYRTTPDWNAQKDAGKVSFVDTPGWRASLERFTKMRDAKCFAPSAPSDTNNDAAAQLGNGQAAMLLANTSITVIASTANPKFKPTIVPVPADKASDTVLTTFLARTIAINKNSKNKDLAKAFIDFMATPPIQKLYSDANAGGEVAPNDFVKGNLPEQWAGLKSALPTSITMPIISWPTPNTLLKVLAPGTQGLLAGQKTADQILPDLDANWGK